MKNHRELMGIVANVLIVFVVLLVIVVGLNVIGVYSLPDWAEKIIGTYDEPKKTGVQNDSSVYESLNLNEELDERYLSEVSLTYENAQALLSVVSPKSDYQHSLTIETTSGESKRREIITLDRTSGLYNAVISDSNLVGLKQIQETETEFVITDLKTNPQLSTSLTKGEFDISDMCGFILNVDAFLESGYVLDEASFSQSNGEFGSVITIDFEASMGELSQRLQYVISLDYGVVVFANCYEQDTLVFEMTTQSLSSAAQQ